MPITIKTEGRRSYITGDTFPHRDALKDGGCHWDGEAKAWWIGSAAKAEALVAAIAAKPPVAPPASYAKIGEEWGIRGVALAKGATVTVRKRDGSSKSETVAEIVETLPDGTMIAKIAPSAKPTRAGGSYSGQFRRRGTWTGCSCGSVEEFERANDCASCRHDR